MISGKTKPALHEAMLSNRLRCLTIELFHISKARQLESRASEPVREHGQYQSRPTQKANKNA